MSDYLSENPVQREKRVVTQLNAWRRTLQKEPDVAERAMKRACGAMLSKNAFMPCEVAQAYSQMKNGVAVPADFMPEGDSNILRRA